jgi:N-acetylmuramoyl-L-alanine amidase
MDRSLLRKTAIQSLALMVAVVTLSYALKQYQMVTMAASNQQNDAISFENNFLSEDGALPVDHTQTGQAIPAGDTQLTGTERLKDSIGPDILKKLGDNFLVVRKPQGDLSLQLEDLYISKSIQLDLAGMTENAVTNGSVLRVRGNDIFTGDPKFTEITSLEVNEDDGTTKEVVTKDFGRDISHGITVTTHKDQTTGLYSSQILIALDSVYAYFIYEDADCYYIDLRKPSEVYDKIIVIDAGHGGKDAGAISKGDKYYEKNINLAILVQLKELLDKEKNIKVYYTRTADSTVYLRPRVELANAVDADYFISIHCNANEVTSPNGTEVLYYDNEFKGVKAVDLAGLFSEELAKMITLKQKGVVKRNYEDIFIMDKSLVPMVLIEVGYLTNKNDMNYLSRTENQKAVAQGIYNGILRAYEELPVTKNGQ